MNRFLLLILTLFFLFFSAFAQKKRVYEGTFYNKEYDVELVLNLYDTCLVVPNYEFLGKMNGYYTGNIHETWFLTKFKQTKDGVLLSFTNEMGADAQDIKITPLDSVRLQYEVIGPNNVRKVQNRKWVKLPLKLEFKKSVQSKFADMKPERTYRSY